MPTIAIMFDPTSNSLHSLKDTYLSVSSRRKQPKKTSSLLSEEFAIVTYGLLIAVFAILMLIVMQTVSAVTGGTLTIWQLLNGKGLFKDGDEL